MHKTAWSYFYHSPFATELCEPQQKWRQSPNVIAYPLPCFDAPVCTDAWLHRPNASTRSSMPVSRDPVTAGILQCMKGQLETMCAKD